MQLPANLTGRDFVVGDLHGAFELLLPALSAVEFDPAVDRLFSVGDLIDRGEFSPLALEFLRAGCNYAVRGNHEQMLLDLYEDGVPDLEHLIQHIQCNGFGWWIDLAPEMQQEIHTRVSALPLVIEIETRKGNRVGLVHGDIPAHLDWEEFIEDLADEDQDVIDTCLWGRDRIRGKNRRGVDGIDRVFVGHTPQLGGIRRYGNVFAIDTGAVYGSNGKIKEGHLTLVNLSASDDELLHPVPAMGDPDLLPVWVVR